MLPQSIRPHRLHAVIRIINDASTAPEPSSADRLPARPETRAADPTGIF